MTDTTTPIEATQPERTPIDANALEAMARERPDEMILKGTGVLKLTGAIRQLEGELRTLRMADPAVGISRELLGKIIDEAFGGSIEDTTPIEDIYRIIVRDVPRNITPHLEALQERLLTPATNPRDKLGHYWHPHLPTCDEHIDYTTLLAAFHIQMVTVSMDEDAPDLSTRYYEKDEPDLTAWNPTPPQGSGWVLLAIHDTEEGPRAWFGHRAAPAPRQRIDEATQSIELFGITKEIKTGRGFWRSCSGCHESNEGQPTGPWSTTMRCHLGNGCSECGGIGAIWDNTDYDAMADAMTNAPETLPGFVKPDTDRAVYFYEQDFYVLSNFSAFALLWHGQRFDTSEAAYQYEKFKQGEGTARVRAAIMNAPSAHQAFKVAQHHSDLRRPDWDDVKVQIMRSILRAKVEQHEYVRRKLLATGDRELVEDSWRDAFWGWGPNCDGQNMLGKLWMEIRAELREQEARNV